MLPSPPGQGPPAPASSRLLTWTTRSAGDSFGRLQAARRIPSNPARILNNASYFYPFLSFSACFSFTFTSCLELVIFFRLDERSLFPFSLLFLLHWSDWHIPICLSWCWIGVWRSIQKRTNLVHDFFYSPHPFQFIMIPMFDEYLALVQELNYYCLVMIFS